MSNVLLDLYVSKPFGLLLIAKKNNFLGIKALRMASRGTSWVLSAVPADEFQTRILDINRGSVFCQSAVSISSHIASISTLAYVKTLANGQQHSLPSFVAIFSTTKLYFFLRRGDKRRVQVNHKQVKSRLESNVIVNNFGSISLYFSTLRMLFSPIPHTSSSLLSFKTLSPTKYLHMYLYRSEIL